MADKIGRRSFLKRASGIIAAVVVAPLYIPAERLDFGVPRIIRADEIVLPDAWELMPAIGRSWTQLGSGIFLPASAFANETLSHVPRDRGDAMDDFKAYFASANAHGRVIKPMDDLPGMERFRRTVYGERWSNG